MRKYLTLTHALLKNVSLFSDGKSNKIKMIGLYGLIALCFLPTLFLFYMMFDTSIQALSILHLESTVLYLGFFIISILIFLFSIFLIPSIFYFSKDLDTLLILPLPPQTILAGKFTTCILYEYAFTIIVSIPLLSAYVSNLHPSIFFYLIALVILVLLPIYPLVLSSVLTMLMMRFVPFFKNRDRFNIIGGFFVIVLAMAFSYFMNSPMMMDEQSNLFTTILTDPDSLVLKLGTWLFPAISFASHALSNTNILHLLVFIAISILSFLIFLLLGKFLYFKGAIGFSETTSTRKRFTSSEMEKLNKQQGKTFAYTKKELKLLFRTPVYFINCISPVILFPILYIIFYFSSSSQISLSILQQLDMSFIKPYLPVIGIGIGFLFSNINCISSTSISREGQNVAFMKYIPVSLKEQIQGKVNSGILISFLTALCSILPLFFIFPLHVMDMLIVIVCSLPSLLFGNYLGILLDMAHPKLVWEQEAAAVKQNFTAMIPMFGGMLILAPLGFLFYYLPNTFLLPVSIIILLALCAGTIVFYRRMDKIANHFFKKL